MWISAFNSAKYDGDWFKISLDENSTQATLSLFAPREHFPNFRDVYGFKTPPVRSLSKYELLGLLNVGTCGKCRSFILQVVHRIWILIWNRPRFYEIMRVKTTLCSSKILVCYFRRFYFAFPDSPTKQTNDRLIKVLFQSCCHVFFSHLI